MSGTGIRELEVSGLENLVARTYHAGYEMQWLREGWRNAVEAGADQIVVGLELASLDSAGGPKYRYAIADNGCGIAGDEMESFLLKYGGSGKPVGELTMNFGVGLKTSTLPWNPAGVVVLSVKDGVPVLGWLQGEKRENGGTRYGMRVWQDPESGESAIYTVPFETAGLDWMNVLREARGKNGTSLFGTYDEDEEEWTLPDGTPAHGTVVVLLGTKEYPHTYLGDPDRFEMGTRWNEKDKPTSRLVFGDHEYLSTRVWAMPDGVWCSSRAIQAREVRAYPTDRASAADPKVKPRRVKGALDGILGTDLSAATRPTVASGEIEVGAGYLPAKLRWYLRDAPLTRATDQQRPGVPSRGYLAALFDNEVYDRTNHHNRYLRFGITNAEIRERLFLVVEPTPYDESDRHASGVHTDDSRSRLRWTSPEGIARDLPWDRWADDFLEAIPDEIREALIAANSASASAAEVPDDLVLRLRARFASRLRVKALIRDALGTLGGTERDRPGGVRPRTGPRKPKKRAEKEKPGAGSAGSTPNPEGKGNLDPGGDIPAREATKSVGLPDHRWEPFAGGNFGAEYVFGNYVSDAATGEKVVLLNQDHPVLHETYSHWTARLIPGTPESAVHTIIRSVYAESAVARVAQVEANLKLYGEDASRVRDAMLSEEALTASLFGLVAEDDRILARIKARGWLSKADVASLTVAA